MQPSLFDAVVLPSPSVAARVCRAQGRARSTATKSRLHRAMIAAYGAQGPLTDAEMAEHIGVERTTVNARRAELVRALAVVAIGARMNPRTGIRNTTWGTR